MIEFERVSYVHPGGVRALDAINLKIETGELVAVMGANGAGKTTLVKHINGLLKPTEGTVRVFGLETRRASVAELSRRVGIVFQNADHQLFSETVEDEIEFGLRNLSFSSDTRRKRVEWAAQFFDLVPYKTFPPMMLSGGEKKRLCVACILAWDPDVIILDEPTVGQDYLQKQKLDQIIKMLLSRGKSVIVVSHDVEFIWPLQPRVIVLESGRIIGDGPAKEIFNHEELLSKSNLTRPQLVELTEHLSARPESPFANIHEARHWILSQLRG